MIHKPTVSWLLCLTISAVPCLQAQQKGITRYPHPGHLQSNKQGYLP